MYSLCFLFSVFLIQNTLLQESQMYSRGELRRPTLSLLEIIDVI